MLIPLIFEVTISLTIFSSSIGVFGQSTCGPKVSARLLMEIPCDMSKTGFCELSGAAYPWAAVRRYIYENQGLLRRMYGDQRHYQILTNEIQDLKDKYDNIFIYDKGSKYYMNKRQPQFRPRSIFMEDDDEHDDHLKDKPEKRDDKSEPASSMTQNSSSESSLPSAAAASPNETSYNQAFLLEDESQTTTESSFKQSPSTESSNILVTSTTGDDSTLDMDTMATTTITTMKSDDNFSPESSASAVPWEKMSTRSTSPMGTASQSPITSTTESSSTINSSPSPGNNVKQDVTKKPETAKKGVNACPVREEVIAPYWANNTRGEVLALLNVYPFEQYVHWEKCAYENSQMFCRDGCRCEQQYRLHRLLAFDPKNECRGIFADWFRFPSCCVCICYNLPESNIVYKTNKRKSRL